jgi:hypothetical protein
MVKGEYSCKNKYCVLTRKYSAVRAGYIRVLDKQKSGLGEHGLLYKKFNLTDIEH